MSAPIAFAGSPLDRADQVRADPEKLAGLMGLRARLLALDGLDPAIGQDGRLVWTSLAEAPPDAELVFLGLDHEERPYFAAVPEAGSTGPFNPRLWAAIQRLEPGDLAIYGGARSLVDWHARHRFCAVCGQGTRVAKGGWQRECAGCDAQHFPRTDPVTIMLVTHGEGEAARLLLGRQPRFPPRSFSALAGFVEPGETIEEAVAREIHEEAGVRVRDVVYIASQPWPFPSQLMIGCHAVAEDDALTIDETEIEEARWFTRAEVTEAMGTIGRDGDGPFNAPPQAAIAHVLLRWWLDR